MAGRTPERGQYVLKREEYGYQWRDLHRGSERFTPGGKRWQEM
jgi:hypothetical protein